MHILVDNSGYGLTNLGDISMLQSTVNRLLEMWPSAHVDVLTGNAKRLKLFCPGADPLVIPKLALWLQLRGTLRPFANQLDALPRIARSILSRPNKDAPEQQELALFGRNGWDGHLVSARQSNLVMATGGGYMNDMFATHAASVLETLKVGVDLGLPTVMVGQGFDPIKHPALVAKAKAVLPKLDLITLREGITGPGVLRSLGVSDDKVIVTGDDAVEPAYRLRPEKLGTKLGVNVRVAWYADVNKEMVDILQGVLKLISTKYDAPLTPIPVSLADPSDVESLKGLLTPILPDTDGGKSIDTPLKAMHRTGECRLVIAGSYHASVFALSQGIPVIALAQAAYYKHKFDGISGQFPGGCTVISLDDPNLRETLTNAIVSTWERADDIRPQLLASAERQIEIGKVAYQKIAGFVDSKVKSVI